MVLQNRCHRIESPSKFAYQSFSHNKKSFLLVELRLIQMFKPSADRGLKFMCLSPPTNEEEWRNKKTPRLSKPAEQTEASKEKFQKPQFQLWPLCHWTAHRTKKVLVWLPEVCLPRKALCLVLCSSGSSNSTSFLFTPRYCVSLEFSCEKHALKFCVHCQIVPLMVIGRSAFLGKLVKLWRTPTTSKSDTCIQLRELSSNVRVEVKNLLSYAQSRRLVP